MIINKNIIPTITKKITNRNFKDEEQLLKYYSYDYEYDNLDRLKTKKYQPDEYTNAIINISKNYTYIPNTKIVNTISYQVKSSLKEDSTNLTYENTYNNGNIIKMIEKGNRFINNPKNEASLDITPFEEKITTYEYDDCNRLIKETRPNQDTYEYVYGETSQMMEQIKKNNTIIKNFEYDHNRLTSINENGIITNILYDQYGNTIQINNQLITYNSRNLMESYTTKDNEKYLFTYNYQGIRCRKEKENG